ncbi:MAG: class IV adenylate cyclase [Candidatus Aenigmarchaeota archaeon]|nr:class IV adenylate cyclase [Candidatus Aenigmarchaeota archaeon]
MAWLEVETKFRVHDAKEMRKRIEKIAVFEKKRKKADDYFAIKRRGYPHKAFRIRATKDEYVVNFKKWLTEYWDTDIVVKREFEFKLTGREHVEHLLELFRDLGFSEWIRKTKVSESYRYRKDKRAGIELNNVEHLGYFVEIEYLCQPHEMEKAKRVIREILRKLGVRHKDIDNTGYTRMLWDRGIRDRKDFLK